MDAHAAKVAKVVESVKALAARKSDTPVQFEKGSVSHFVPNPYSDEAEVKIDFSPLKELLEIDEKAMTATAEPGLTFCDLTQATLAKGLMPYVVPELKTITIGGAVSGCSIEAMSYKYGGFHDNCIEYEIITGTGEVITCSEEKDPDVFNMIHGSYGTLGLITRLKFKLVPAKPFVKLENRLFDNFEDYWKELNRLCKTDEFTFIDSIIHSTESFVLCLGNLVEEAPYHSDYSWLDIYYKSTLEKREDYMQTHDYFFRYDAECHWLTKTVPLMETKAVRFLIGKLILGSTNLITWSNRIKSILRLKKRPEVVVDVFIPSNRFEEFFRWYEKDFDFFPLWIVPYKMPGIYPWVDDEYAAQMEDSFVIDAAVYGKINNHPSIDYSKLIEDKVYELNGVKTLISRNHYDEETFSRPRIEAMKKRLDPDNLLGGLYQKFSPENYS